MIFLQKGKWVRSKQLIPGIKIDGFQMDSDSDDEERGGDFLLKCFLRLDDDESVLVLALLQYFLNRKAPKED